MQKRISESTNQRISESANQRINESTNQRINESTNQRINEPRPSSPNQYVLPFVYSSIRLPAPAWPADRPCPSRQAGLFVTADPSPHNRVYLLRYKSGADGRSSVRYPPASLSTAPASRTTVPLQITPSSSAWAIQSPDR